jgi:hypothetical protein
VPLHKEDINKLMMKVQFNIPTAKAHAFLIEHYDSTTVQHIEELDSPAVSALGVRT